MRLASRLPHCSILSLLVVTVLVCKATALKCYQAPKSWGPCWTDPNGQPHGTDEFRGDSRFQMDYENSCDVSATNPTGAISVDGKKKKCHKSWTHGTRKKCTIPCGGVGLLPRENIPAYEIKTACSACTWCQKTSDARRTFIEEKEACEAVGCCEWEEGTLWGGYCNAAKTGLCTATSTHQGGASARIDRDTELVPSSGIACKVV